MLLQLEKTSFLHISTMCKETSLGIREAFHWHCLVWNVPPKRVRNSPLFPSLCLVIESVNSRGQLECVNTQCSISQSSEKHALLYIPGLSCSSLHSSPLWQTDGHTIESTGCDQHQLYHNITEHKAWKRWSNERNVIMADSTTTTSVELYTCIIFQ